MSVYLIDTKSHEGDGKAAVTRRNRVIKTLSKPRRQRQGERHKTKGLMSRAMVCPCVINLSRLEITNYVFSFGIEPETDRRIERI